MKKITLRTKIEATLVLLLLVSIVAAASVISVTRMISDSHDDVDTYIRNSNGNYWECTEANIQAAIDDLSGSGWKGGTVWLPGDQEIDINTGIVLENYCILDLGGSYLNAKSDVHMITMAQGSVVRDGQMDTRDVDPFTKSCILFDCAEDYWESNTRVEDIYMYSENSEGTGIYYRADNQGEKAAFTKCVGVSIWKFEYGIRLDCQGGTDSGSMTYINSNIFNNIVLIRNKYQIWLDRNTDVNHNQCDVDGNIFDNCILQTGYSTERSVYVEGRYNRFTNIFTWDWSAASGERITRIFFIIQDL